MNDANHAAMQEAARVLALEIDGRQRNLDRAMKKGGQDEIVQAATDLAILLKENQPFIVFALKSFGGLSPSVPVRVELPSLPADLTGIGANRETMTSGAAVAAATK